MNSQVSSASEHSEIAFVLFTDLVAYSNLTMPQQRRVRSQLEDVARNTRACQLAKSKSSLIYRSTGDGIALCFFEDPEAPVHCAKEISTGLKSNPSLSVRMGIHSGPIFRVTDVNDYPDIIGGGINTAQRVMDIGNAGHILLSKAIADILIELGDWRPFLHDLGEVTVKHDKKVHIYNFYSDDFGNSDMPMILRPSAKGYAATASEDWNSGRKETQAGSSTLASVSGRIGHESKDTKRFSSRYCLHCGMLLPSGGRSCSHCGR
jgi:class 3 adenylate cyclase